ncbi:MAG: calcineurin-like phosphoesterase family protein [Planctomycetaceae bacterium]
MSTRFTSAVASVAVAVLLSPVDTIAAETARGVVFEDANGNGERDQGERGIAGVSVSNGEDVVQTASDGTYELPVTDDTILFVVKPSHYQTPTDENHIPRFYYVHKPNGSPRNLKFPGVDPTGPLPSTVNFPLTKSAESPAFDVVFFGDPQPRDQKEIDYIAHDVIEGLVGEDAAFGVTLGDILFDDLSLFDSLNRTVGKIGIPWYNVIGNHDINYASETDELSDETFERVYGPAYYSFNYGNIHFISVDDVHWMRDGDRKFYRSGLSERQLTFIENDLANVPQDQLVVAMMHIPLVRSTPWLEPRREKLLRLLESREHCISLAGHTHHHEHVFMNEQDGWKGSRPHHHIINVTVCGSWWSGKPSEEGIPHTMCADGTPNGHTVMHFDGTKYQLEYRAARREPEYQIRITAPEVVAAADAEKQIFHANAFNAMPNAVVEWKLDSSSEWIPMIRELSPDPLFQTLVQEETRIGEALLWRKLPKPMVCPHLWKANLGVVEPGTHLIHVRATNSDGIVMTGTRIIRIN